MQRSAPIFLQSAPICRLNRLSNQPIMRARVEEEFPCGYGNGKYREALMSGAEIARPPVHRITLAQLALLVPLCFLLLAIDEVCAYSVACGGLVAILPQAWFAFQVFRRRGAGVARTVAGAGSAGFIAKFLLSATGFAVVFAMVRPIDGLAVFAGYLAMLVIQLFGSWVLLRQQAAN